MKDRELEHLPEETKYKVDKGKFSVLFQEVSLRVMDAAGVRSPAADDSGG